MKYDRQIKFGLFMAAGLSFLFSIYLWFMVSKDQGIFVGLWVPSILAMGTLYFSGRSKS